MLSKFVFNKFIIAVSITENIPCGTRTHNLEIRSLTRYPIAPKGQSAEGGIRTHEAVAVDLKSTPFDRSGTSAICHIVSPVL